MPTAVVVTTADGLVPAARQRAGGGHPGRHVHLVDGDHGVFVTGQAALHRRLVGLTLVSDACRS